MSLKGRVALVTGGSAGLGAAVVRKLAAEGCDVAINYANSKSRAEALSKEVGQQYGIKTAILQGDVGKKEACQGLVKDTIELLGRLDIIVSNAGWTRLVDFSDIDQLTEEDFDRCYAMNVKAHFFLFQAAKPHWNQSQDGGSFILSASIAGIKVGGSSLPYAVTKAGSVHLVKCLAKTQGSKIRTNVVCPGLLKTEWAEIFGEEKIAQIEEAAPLKQSTGIDDTADMYVALARNRSTTGAVVVVDAGISL